MHTSLIPCKEIKLCPNENFEKVCWTMHWEGKLSTNSFIHCANLEVLFQHVFTRKFNNTNEIAEYPPNKYIKLTLPNESLPSITYDANLFRINSDSSESSLEYAETASNSTNEFDPIRDDSEAAEWRDVLSFFCGEFEQDDPDLMFNFQESWR